MFVIADILIKKNYNVMQWIILCTLMLHTNHFTGILIVLKLKVGSAKILSQQRIEGYKY